MIIESAIRGFVPMPRIDNLTAEPSTRGTSMRIANLRGRSSLVEGPFAVDVETASGGTFDPDPAAIYARWTEFSTWAAGYAVDADPKSTEFDERDLGAPSPGARQVFRRALTVRSSAGTHLVCRKTSVLRQRAR